MAGGFVGKQAEEGEHTEERALAEAVAADAYWENSSRVGDRHREGDLDKRERQAEAAGEQPDGEEIEEPDGIARGEGGEESSRLGAGAGENIGERGGMGRTEPAGQKGWRPAAEDSEGDGTGDGEGRADDEQQAKLRVEGDGLKFEQKGEGCDTQQDDEAENAVDQGGGEAGGLPGRFVATEIKHPHGIAAEAAEEEGVVEIADPGGDVGPVKGEADTLGAKEQPPAPCLKREGESGDERGEHDGAEIELAAQAGELVPIDAPDERADEQRGERVARDATGASVEKGEETAHER